MRSKDTLVILEHGPEGDGDADDETCDHDGGTDCCPDCRVRVDGDSGEDAVKDDGDADQDGAQAHLFAEGDAVLLGDAVGVIGMEHGDVAPAVGDADGDANDAHKGRNVESCHHILLTSACAASRCWQ